jgi:hypothetical protein
MSHPIKVFETDEGTIFEMDYSEDILEMYSDNYFTNRGVQAKLNIIVDNEHLIKGGGGPINEEQTITIPYRYFYYRAKYLLGIGKKVKETIQKKQDTPQQKEEPIEKKEDTPQQKEEEEEDVTKVEEPIEKKEKSVFIEFFKGIPDKIMGFFNGLKDLGRNVKASIYTNPVEVKPIQVTSTDDSREHVDSEKEDNSDIDVDDIGFEEEEDEDDIKKIRIIVDSKEIKKIEKDKLTYKELRIIFYTLNEKIRKNIIWENGVYIINNRCAILNIEEEEGDENEKLLNIWEGSEIYKKGSL